MQLRERCGRIRGARGHAGGGWGTVELNLCLTELYQRLDDAVETAEQLAEESRKSSPAGSAVNIRDMAPRHRKATIQTLPPEILVSVMGCLSPHELLVASHVSHAFREAATDDRLWRMWAESELRSWGSWRLEAVVEGTCRDFVLKCLDTERWILTHVFGTPERQSWDKITVGYVCNIYAVGALKRLAECYSPEGALFWWGRVRPPPQSWDQDEWPITPTGDTKRYNPYAGRAVPAFWEEPTPRYLPSRFKWDSAKYAYAGFDWSDAADAAQLYALCRRFLATDVLIDAWEGSIEKWDLLDAFEAVQGYQTSVDHLAGKCPGNVGEGAAKVRSPLPADLADRHDDNVEMLAHRLLEHYMSTPPEDHPLSDYRDGPWIVLRVMRDLACRFDIKWVCDTRVAPIIVVEANGECQFVFDLKDKTTRDVSEFERLYASHGRSLPSPGKSQNLLLAVRALLHLQPERSPLLNLLQHEEYLDPESHHHFYGNCQLRPRCKPFWIALSDATTPPAARSTIRELRHKLLADYVAANNMSTSGVQPFKIPEELEQLAYPIGCLVAIDEPLAGLVGPKQWAVVTDHTELAWPKWVLPVELYGCRTVGRNGHPRWFGGSEVLKRRRKLNPSEAPTRYGSYIRLGETFSHIEDGQFVPKYKPYDSAVALRNSCLQHAGRLNSLRM